MSFPRPDRTVVINLYRRYDRLAVFRVAYAIAGWHELLGEPQLFEAIDGATMHNLPEYWAANPARRTAWGRWASHAAVLCAAARDGVDALAVFEDHAVPHTSSEPYLRHVLRGLPPETAGLWLDASTRTDDNDLQPATFGTARLTRPPLLAHAYLLRRDAIDRMMHQLTTTPDHIEAHLAVVDLDGPVYATVPALAPAEDAIAGHDWEAFFA